jgi:cytochrome oxidase Cu insertion factor (SCO1/SenC/PrrC family)
MKSLALKVWVSFFVMLTCAYGAFVWYRHNRATVEADTNIPRAAVEVPLNFHVADFSLTERSGRPFQSSELRGKPWIASFFFTACPGPCRQVNTELAQLQQEFAKSDVRFVSITVDPQNDTPEVLQAYAKQFNADADRWLFLTGPLEEIRQVAEGSLKVALSRVTHSTRLILINRQGKVDGYFDTSTPADMTALKFKLARYAEEAS